MGVKIVTDSTSDLPPALAEELGITVVPLTVQFGSEVFIDRVTMSPDEFFERLTLGEDYPTTSQPSVGDFVEAYERIGADADGIVSIHVSDKVSGTLNSARLASEQAEVSCPIEVLDTYSVSMGVTMVAMEAARAASAGGDVDHVAGVAADAIDRCQVLALLDTLEYLEKGGRIGKAQALLGTLLRVKPMIILREGVVHELAKARTRRKGIAKLERTAREFAPLVGLAVMHSTTPDEADALAKSLAGLLESGSEPMVMQFGPVLGTYVGPGAIGIGLLSAPETDG
ncbi:MAG: DegV family protein [SAR202 cluster bacterium]|jgi:DegV family protein with EDD domain|nr:DegV family protein [SAR202 cluster bacterium]MDP6662798.1 DegV family protein [SAR202 cluster bacterium]MQG58678.1 DegV family protein [SAR202 cluster bacterium]MQG70496.1 DegV family protein [SAR202 cluster bacterium]HAL47545.1 DegV family protein [Dehalococcoidia bacterium]|tara:strand:- start:10111 stop:10965 length:855 start_codon:yes stop_codon:yes gene_type:complete